ncbi:MAG TPA: AMP-binding protein [Azospirillaceae bacterium]|nr:AMP-binding protein [Azospirillaceae bacterium]
MRWWQDAPTLRRVVVDLVAGEWSRLRPGAPAPDGWDDDGLEIAPGGLGADSLELTSLATALVETLQLHRAGFEDYLLRRRTLGDWVAITRASLERADQEITFRTSGSTGEPKPCAHTLERLEEEAGGLADILKGTTRVLAAVPAHHIYGFLFTVLLPLKLGVPVEVVRGRLPGRVVAELRPGDLLVAVPDWWNAAARAGAAIPAGATGTSSTAPLPAETAALLRLRGLSRLVEIYGSSETAGLGWRDDPAGPYTLFPWWRPEADGALRHARLDLIAEPPDHLAFQPDGRFRLEGRRDGAVQVGGTNIFPARVASVLREHPDVADAAVRPHAVAGGLRLKAFIVPSPGISPDSLRAGLEGWMAGRLTPPERPRALTFGATLPRTEMGKPADWPVTPDHD